MHGWGRDAARPELDHLPEDLIDDTARNDAPLPESDTLDPLTTLRRVEPWAGTSYEIINPRLLKDRAGCAVDAPLIEHALPSRHIERAPRPGLWLRASDGSEVGPVALPRAMQIVRDQRRRAPSTRMEVSGDRRRWTPWARFTELIEQDAIDPSSDFPENAIVGLLEQVSVVSLLGRLARRRATGRLIVVQLADRLRRTELDLFEGLPTAAIVSDPELTLDQQLIRHHVIAESDLEKHVQRAVSDGRSLRQVILTDAQIDIDCYRTKFMRERIEPMMATDRGTYAFAIEPVDHSSSFAPTLFSLMIPLVAKMRRLDELRAVLAPRRALPLRRTARFRTIVPHLLLADAERFAIEVFGRTPTLDDAIRVCPKGERFATVAAYVLIELGLLGMPRGPVDVFE